MCTLLTEYRIIVQNSWLNLSGDSTTILIMSPQDFVKRNPGSITRDRVANQPDRSSRDVRGNQKSPFISTGLQSVDDAMRGGFARDCMTHVASRPRVGATSLLVGSVLAALQRNLKVAYYSDRLNQRQLRGRLILRASEINGYRIQAGLMTEQEEYELDKARGDIRWDNLLMHCRKEVMLTEVLSQCARNPPDLLVADFKPHDASTSSKAGFRSYEQGLRELARHVGKCGSAAVVRQVLPKGSHAPDRIELPGLGSITNIFESAVMMHRHTGEGEDGDVDTSRAFAQVIRVQHRDIKTRSVALHFDQRFAGLLEREV